MEYLLEIRHIVTRYSFLKDVYAYEVLKAMKASYTLYAEHYGMVYLKPGHLHIPACQYLVLCYAQHPIWIWSHSNMIRCKLLDIMVQK